MIKKCMGCGIILQEDNLVNEGYIKKIDNDLCERCFRIKNYGDYQAVVKDNDTFMSILQTINKTNSLVVLVIDLTNIPRNLDLISKSVHNDLLLVLTKRDLIPKSVYDTKLLNYVKGRFCAKIIISSEKNYQFDELFDLINKYKIGQNVYVVGYTNAGKSTMINKLIYNYSDSDTIITTSILPSTTLGTIDIKLTDELTIIDTPGILETGSIINYVDALTLKKIMPNKTIRPVTYQIKVDQFLSIDDLLMMECLSDNSLTFYFSNQLEIERVFKQPVVNPLFVSHKVEVEAFHDVVIEGLGFIKVIKKTTLIIYTLPLVNVYTREPLI